VANPPNLGETTGGATLERSTFITVLAWLLIVGAGLGVFMTSVQVVVIVLLAPNDLFPADKSIELPMPASFLAAYPFLIFGVFWASAVAALAAGVGLLRRKNWARLVFLGLLCLAVMWNLGSIWIAHSMLGHFSTAPAGASDSFAREFETAAAAMRIAATLFSLVVTAVCCWLAWRLLSKQVRAEFKSS
jgi:lysylphosphatidylglycerol synthetase-like protein (DUF2156 family)